MLAWLPERITPLSVPSLAYSRTQSSLTSQGCTSQNTWASRTRRAISWVTCEPKSRMRIFWCCMRCYSKAKKEKGVWFIRRLGPLSGSISPVVRRFLGDLHVVDMAFAYAGGRDFHELGLVAHVFDGGATAVTHAGPQAAGHLEHDRD